MKLLQEGPRSFPELCLRAFFWKGLAILQSILHYWLVMNSAKNRWVLILCLPNVWMWWWRNEGIWVQSDSSRINQFQGQRHRSQIAPPQYYYWNQLLINLILKWLDNLVIQHKEWSKLIHPRETGKMFQFQYMQLETCIQMYTLVYGCIHKESDMT